jgi:hypothetical protein
VRKCEADVSHTKLWAQGSFGMLCGSLATINASTASIYKYGSRTHNARTQHEARPSSLTR